MTRELLDEMIGESRAVFIVLVAIVTGCGWQGAVGPGNHQTAGAGSGMNVPTSSPFEHHASIPTLPALKSHLEHHWPLERIRSFCAHKAPTHSQMQNLAGDKRFEYGSQLHNEDSGDVGLVYWYGCTDDRRVWVYSVNVVKGPHWWWLELGGLRSDVEAADDAAYRMNGQLWEEMWKRVGNELDRASGNAPGGN